MTTQEERRAYNINEMMAYIESEVMTKITKNQDMFRDGAKRYCESIADDDIKYQEVMHCDARTIVMRIGMFMTNGKGF